MELSDDSEANMSIENSLLAPKERAINMVITKLFTKFHCNVEYQNDCILYLFRSCTEWEKHYIPWVVVKVKQRH